jgi:2-polyprenyl-6-hydroxyphenyl methylase/3-demethylubiquinone-9 3-methyltransferase
MSTINKEEIQKFENIADDWWNPEGKFKPIHKFNPVRISFIVDVLKSHFNLKEQSSMPLKNLKILDLGCGGGLLSEPMARLGAQVTGLDASKSNIRIAQLHALKNKLKINYIHGSIEKTNFKTPFDVILNMEIIEHVNNVDLFIKSCRKNIKNSGVMFIATLNRTLKSYLFAIIGAEYVLRWLPIGTHDWNKFITPNELNGIANKNKFQNIKTSGVVFSPLTSKWSLNSDQNVNYISVFSSDN